MISVIIPLYNKKKTIKKTIESILSQSYKDLEIIIVDDGSIDGGADAAQNCTLPDPVPLKIIKISHSGAPTARNYGAHLAQGEYLFFCDADIILKKDALQKLLAALTENKNAAYAYCSFQLGWKKMPSRPFDAEALKKQNYISTMSLIRRNDFPGFDESLKKFQDWDLWLAMLAQGKRGVFIPQVLFTALPGKIGISKWLPRIFYKMPWLKEVKKYNEAKEKIVKKHKL
jgi:glycosyltransferase involved in cell wall biosynthesis